MVTLTVVIASAVGKSLASVKTQKLAPVASKVKSTFSKLASNHKAGVVAAGSNRLRRRSRKEVERRCARKSLPRVLAPFPDDLHVSLVTEVEDELLRLHADDSDKASKASHSTGDSESTLLGSDESKMYLFSSDKITVADLETSAVDFEVEGEAPSHFVHAREAFSAAELALFEIKVVPKVVLPQEDYYTAEGLVPIAGYDVPEDVQ
ncbi:hypothetical protein BV20DRAFT_999752 [Pilatotrama ljubarskyi]|nr:hypothetical protein BV20DRAFT_999752 [Pilatotrama ljubarskyi]